MCNTKLILDLYKSEKITLDEAVSLLEQNAKVIWQYFPQYQPSYYSTGTPVWYPSPPNYSTTTFTLNNQ
jgi:hypothetical protein